MKKPLLISVRFLCSLVCLLVFLSGTALAVPETVSVQVTDVTPSSFSVIWMSDVAANPEVEVFADVAMVTRLTEGIVMTPMPDAPPAVAAAARKNGIMKVRVSGLAPDTTYFVRSVTRNPAIADSIGYSGVKEVVTAREIVPYRFATDGSLAAFSNDLLAMRVFIRPNDVAEMPGLGNLLILGGAAHPVSAFVGAGIAAPYGVIDLNNLFGQDLKSYAVQGGEKIVFTIYRGGTLSSLSHYRLLPITTGSSSVVDPVRGFFADINLDGRVDGLDFDEFRKQYRAASTGSTFNPDFDFFVEASGIVDARDFARFAREYGRNDVK